MRIDVDSARLIKVKLMQHVCKELAAIGKVVEGPANCTHLAIGLIANEDDLCFMQVTCKVFSVQV